MSDLDAKLKEYGTEVKVAAGAGKEFPPSLYLSNKDGAKRYLEGTLLAKRTVKVDDIDKQVFTFSVKDTDAPTVRKGNEVTIAEGDEVEVWGTADLNRKLSTIADGTDLLITYNGKKKKVTAKGTIFPHDFTVRIK